MRLSHVGKCKSVMPRVTAEVVVADAADDEEGDEEAGEEEDEEPSSTAAGDDECGDECPLIVYLF